VTIDNFMNELRHSDGLTRQVLANAFEFSDSIPKTQIVGSVLVIRADFLELCRAVIGLRLPALACQEEACGFQVHGANELTGGKKVLRDEGLPHMSCHFTCNL